MAASDPRLVQLLQRALLWNTPLSATHADLLLSRLEVRPGVGLVDLGCGWGELLLRAVARSPTTTGDGVDTNAVALDRGRELAERRGLTSRVSFHLADATEYPGTSDRVICIGASHAWGGTSAALAGVEHHLSAGGRALYGDGFWARPSTPDLVPIFGELEPSFADLVDRAVRAGLRPLHADVATEAEWDEFEWNTYRGLEEFALDQPSDPLAPAARELANARRNEYLRGYRGVVGFAYLILAKP